MGDTMPEKTEAPFALFKTWFDEAEQKSGMKEHNAMTLATSTEDGKPSARIVLLKTYDERGFCFFTNMTSRKGKELAENQNVALCFYWETIGKQIRIEGKVEKVSQKESDDYFASRRRGSQIGAWASKQSTHMETDDALINRVKEITEQFEAQTIPRPPFWGGYRVVPNRIEFWQAGEFRLHTRIIYSKVDGGWNVERLYP